MDGEQIFDIEAVIADLEARKAVIDNMIQGLRTLYASGAGSAVIGAVLAQGAPAGNANATAIDPAKIPSTAFFGIRSIGDAAVKYLTLVKRTQTTKQIVAALERGGFPHQSSNIYSATYVALQRREEQGDVMRIGSEWAMASWFPGRGRKSEPTAKRPKKRRAGTVAEETKPRTRRTPVLALKPAGEPERGKAVAG